MDLGRHSMRHHPEAGRISCEIAVGGKGWEKFVIQAFDKTHALTAADLAKLVSR